MTQGRGTRYIGDSEGAFEVGEMVFVSKNVPQLWLSSEEHFKEDSGAVAEGIVLNFSENCLGRDFFYLPELTSLKDFLSQSGSCFRITGKTHLKISELLRRLLQDEGIQKVLTFLEILSILCNSQELESLMPYPFHGELLPVGNLKVEKALLFLGKNYQKELPLNQVAQFVGMNPSAFSRLFRQRTGKTWKEYLTGLRLTHAKRLLLHSDYTISHICFDCGFNNLSNFIRRFKKVVGVTPQAFRKSNGLV